MTTHSQTFGNSQTLEGQSDYPEMTFPSDVMPRINGQMINPDFVGMGIANTAGMPSIDSHMLKMGLLIRGGIAGILMIAGFAAHLLGL